MKQKSKVETMLYPTRNLILCKFKSTSFMICAVY